MNVQFEVRNNDEIHATTATRREAERIMTALQNQYLVPMWIAQVSKKDT